MFEKIEKTTHAPEKTTMVWDGDCGFCKYWIIRWKNMTGDLIEYKTYQEAAGQFNDIDVEHFKTAVRLIEPDGTVYNGPEAAYKAYQLADKKNMLLSLYQRLPFFRQLSDRAYDFIANNRPLMMKITHRAFGKDPEHQKPYWAFYGFGLLFLIWLLTRPGKRS